MSDCLSHCSAHKQVPQPPVAEIAFVGERAPLRSLAQEYRGNAGLRDKIELLAEQFPSWLPIRGDGNCFYHALLFAMVRSLELRLRWRDALAAA